MLLKREDSMSLQEPFEFNLFMMNEEDMLDPKFMEEALSVLHQSDGLEPSPNSTLAVGNTSGTSQSVGPVTSGVGPIVPVSGPAGVPGGAAWAQHMEDIVDVVLRDSRASGAVGEGTVAGVGSGVASAGDLHMGELWPGDLDPLSGVWEGLVAADAAIEQRKAESSAGFEPGEVSCSQADPDGPAPTEEIVEVEVEQVDLEAPGQCAVLAELQALDQADQEAANPPDCTQAEVTALSPTPQRESLIPPETRVEPDFSAGDEPPVIGVAPQTSGASPQTSEASPPPVPSSSTISAVPVTSVDRPTVVVRSCLDESPL